MTSLVNPTPQVLLEAILEMERISFDLGYSCCRNCFKIGESVNKCGICGVYRCEKCRPVHRLIEHALVTYGILELGFSPIVLESLLHAYHVNVIVCVGCPLEVCLRCCGTKLRLDSEGKPWCSGCTYVCQKCSVVVFSGRGWQQMREKLCYKCV